MTRQIFASALFAGLAAGLVAAALQFMFVIPLLLEGELYETGARVHFVLNGSTQSEAGAPPLGLDLARHLPTIAMSVVVNTAFALLLCAGFALSARKGHAVTARRGAIWGLAAFIAVQLLPAAGLVPELPGSIAANYTARLTWWSMTIAASITGLALIGFGRGYVPFVGIALLLIPHLVGAPLLDTYYGVAPPELAALFVTRSLAVACATWVVLGSVAGYVWTRAAHIEGA